MTRTLFAVLAAVVVSVPSCLGTAGALPEGDAGPGELPPPPPLVTVRLRTVSDPCGALPSATVFRPDGGVIGVSDVSGGVGAAEVPASGELRVESAGTVPTWNTLRALRDGGEAVLLGIPREVYTLAFSASSLEPSPARGHLVLSVVDERMLPIAGASFVVDDTRGSTTRYVGVAGVLPTFDAGSPETQPHLGLGLVLNVEPGRHGLHVRRGGVALDDGEVEVHAGAVTFFELVVPGQEGTPAPFFGAARATPALPGFGPQAPLRAARTVLHEVERGTELEQLTDDGGSYSFEVPFARRWVDVSYPDPPFGPFRSELICVQPLSNQWTWALDDHFYEEQYVLAHLRGAPFDPGLGVVMAETTTQGGFGDAIVGATVTLAGAAPAAYTDGTLSGPCVRGGCGDGGACPSGTRCEGGECLAGPSPVCARCASGCPTGAKAWVLPGDLCRCFPTRADCRAPAPACPADTSCVPMLVLAADGGAVPAPPLCVPAPLDSTGTLRSPALRAWPAMFTAVDAGVLVLEATAPGRRFAPTRVRVSPGSVVHARVREVADGG